VRHCSLAILAGVDLVKVLLVIEENTRQKPPPPRALIVFPQLPGGLERSPPAR
jgi:hypothetical protein